MFAVLALTDKHPSGCVTRKSFAALKTSKKLAAARPVASNKSHNAPSRAQSNSISKTNLNPHRKANANLTKVRAHDQPVPKRFKIDPASYVPRAKQNTTDAATNVCGKASLAATFMRQVKAALSTEQMNIFKSALRDFKLYRSRRGQRSIDIAKQWSGTQQVIDDLFAKVSNGEHLRRGFTKFTQRLNPLSSSLHQKNIS